MIVYNISDLIKRHLGPRVRQMSRFGRGSLRFLSHQIWSYCIDL